MSPQRGRLAAAVGRSRVGRGAVPALGAAALTALAAAATIAGCAATPAPAPPPRGPAPAVVTARAGVPPLLPLEREGDPDGAVALGVAHPHGLRASRALGAALSARLAAAALPVEATPSALGLTVTVRAAASADAGRALRALAAALAAPLSAGDPATAAAVDAAGAPAPAAADPVDVCSGDAAEAQAGGADAPDARAVERWRIAAHRQGTAAFSVVGAAPWGRAAREAHDALAPWPAAAPGAGQGWPAPSHTLGAAGPGAGELTVALRVPDGAAALSAAERLLGAAGPGGELAARLRTLDPPWAVERVAPTLHPYGACLRVELAASQARTAGASLGAAAAVAEEELTDALGAPPLAAPVEWARRLPDAADAAASAAWQVLHAPATREPVTLLRFSPGASAPALAEAALEAAHRAARQRPALPVTTARERGQGQLWLLLGSPCGTRHEGRAEAGHTLTALTALSALPGEVTLEAWTTPDGAGLVAHAPSRPGEAPLDHARRVAAAAARALGGARGDAVERSAALLESARRVAPLSPARSTALELLSGGHPGWLDPTGTPLALNGATPGHLEAARQALARGPLRAAVLHPYPTEPRAAVERELGRWLHQGGPPTPCEPPGPRVAPAGLVELGRRPSGRDAAWPAPGAPTPTAEGAPPSAVVAAALPAASPEARALVFLLGRRGGWLEQALGNVTGARAQARLVGGAERAALLVEITATESTQRALDEVRGLLDGLGARGVSAAELEAARAEQAAWAAARRRDPRARLLRAWGTPEPEPPRADRLAALLPALRASALLVVTDPGG